jgi:hypothetical protein
VHTRFEILYTPCAYTKRGEREERLWTREERREGRDESEERI